MSRRKNPSVAGLPCCFCGAPAQAFGHWDAKGMGGDPQGLRTDGGPVCGVDHSDPNTCHGAIAIGEIHAALMWLGADEYVQFRCHGKTAERLGLEKHVAHLSRFYGKTFDEIGESA